MFKSVDTELGHVICKCREKYKKDFEKLGFVDDLSKVKPYKKLTRKRKVKTDDSKQGQHSNGNLQADENQRLN